MSATNTRRPFAEITAEYDAALAASREAEARLRAAGAAYVAAQCGALMSVSPSDRRGYNRHLFCTLEKGHDGRHENVSSNTRARS